MTRRKTRVNKILSKHVLFLKKDTFSNHQCAITKGIRHIKKRSVLKLIEVNQAELNKTCIKQKNNQLLLNKINPTT